jgi:pyridoxine 4-dehydrogenase
MVQQINPVASSGTLTIGGDLKVYRLGFGAMRLTGRGVWGPPDNKQEALAVLHRAVELGINFIDTADSYGPEVSETLTISAPARTNGCQMAAPNTCARRWRAA